MMKPRHLLPAVATLAALTLGVPAHAQDPGLPIPTSSETSALKRGAVLLYPYYTSADPALQDTRLTLTNGDVNPQRVHVFFVDGTSGAVGSQYVCLGGNQTSSFKMSTLDPGATGYAVAVAVNGTTGCPIGTEGNQLSGTVHVKRADGFRGTLPALGVAALYSGSIAGCSGASVTAVMAFDGVSYNRLSRVVSIDNIPSRGDAKSTLLIAGRASGNLTSAIGPVSRLFGTMFDDAENRVSWSLPVATTQLDTVLRNGVPLTPPPFETFNPAGRTGWTKLRIYPSDTPLLAAAFFTAPTGSINLPAETLSVSGTLTMPVTAPPC
jgi:hypothetical protein